MYRDYYGSTLGLIELLSDGEALTGLTFIDIAPPSGERMEGEREIFKETKRWLDIYFSGRDPGFTPPLKLDGSDFRKHVWKILLGIPYGATTTYGGIAGIISKETGREKMSARAVGGAVGDNPVALIVPCHRVIGSDGSLEGYRAGLLRKRILLEMEKKSIDN